MKKEKFVTPLLVISFSFMINHGGTTGDEKLLIRANNEFASKYYKVLAAQPSTDDNLIFCPLCLSTGMALLSVGAGGSTLTEIQTSLGFPSSESVLLQGYSHLIQNQVRTNKLTFNGLFFTKNQTKIEISYQNKTEKYFQTFPRHTNSLSNEDLKEEIEGLMRKDPDTSGETDSSERDERIDSQSEGESSIILANYLKFKAGWEKKFEVSSTTQEPFYVSSEEIIATRMMRQTGHFNIIRIPELNSRAIAIPYMLCDGFNLFQKSSAPATKTLRSKPRLKRVCKSGVRDSRLQLVVIIPNEQGGLSQLEAKLTPKSFLEIPPKFEYKSYLDLSFPKFSLHSTQDLVNLTAQFNMETMSSTKADFSRISESGPLRVSKIFHHVSFQVDEKGSKTKSSHLKGRNPWTHPKIVKIDQPFLAFVHDKKLDAILIVFRVVRPTSP